MRPSRTSQTDTEKPNNPRRSGLAPVLFAPFILGTFRKPYPSVYPAFASL
jgi:hypothetical protein